ncbi:MAG: hypothetical protein AB1673_04220 [Actinomycetota bacterium]
MAGALLVAACGAPAPGPEAQLSAGPMSPLVRTAALAGIDRSSLPAALRSAGVVLPPGTNVYAAVVDGRAPQARAEYEAGGGGGASGFWPASSVKLLAAVGALEYLGTLGFTGSATVAIGGGQAVAVRTLYWAAVTESSNDAYDRLVEVAGVDWLNETFLSPARGFPVSVVQRSYAFGGVLASPPMTVREGDREVSLPARPVEGDYGVVAAGNVSNLLEMTESVRRVVFHRQLPPGDRFAIADADADALRRALRAAESFIEPAVASVLAADARLYAKPGFVEGDDCVDVALVDDPSRPEAYLLGISSPDDGQDCAVLVRVAEGTLNFLTGL